jgi:hypothetical protein
MSEEVKSNMENRVKVTKAAVAIGLLIGVVPYLCGLLFEMILFSPLRVPIYQSPLYLASENWVMGTLYVKIACATTMMTPQNFWLRRTLERVRIFHSLNLSTSSVQNALGDVQYCLHKYCRFTMTDSAISTLIL